MDWAYMLKLGTNMWCDVVPPKWAHYTADELHYKGAADHLHRGGTPCRTSGSPLFRRWTLLQV